jgi:DNA (cytosine-5)-methyltransferase 1
MLTLRDVIAGLEKAGLDECARFGKKMASFMVKIPEGGNWRNFDSADRKKAMGGANLKSGGLTGCYRRLSFDKPSPTLLTTPTQRATTLCHPTEQRPLSVLEYRRIQGIPDRWSIMGSTSQKYRQIGNAVPVQLGLAVARSIIAATQGAVNGTKKDEAGVTWKSRLRQKGCFRRDHYYTGGTA